MKITYQDLKNMIDLFQTSKSFQYIKNEPSYI